MNIHKEKLQLFINDVLEHPVLRESTITWNFFTMSDETSYEKIKNSYVMPVEISEVETLEGKTKVKFNADLDNSSTETYNTIKGVIAEFKT